MGIACIRVKVQKCVTIIEERKESVGEKKGEFSTFSLLVFSRSQILSVICNRLCSIRSKG